MAMSIVMQIQVVIIDLLGAVAVRGLQNVRKGILEDF
jgi:hypothetical protein